MARIDVIEKYYYLVGQKINKWTVLDIVKIGKYNRPHAICECECGNVKPVWTSNLINNRSQDCGCGRKAMLRETRTKNLVGQRFGKLVVMELLEDSNEFKRRVYRCKCDCGNDINVPSSSLTTYHTLSCGCLISYWNMYIKNLLKENKIIHKTEYVVTINGNKYRFDFYLPQYNLVIEYDGRQHYEPVRFPGMNIEDVEINFKTIQERDKIKNRYCDENNINMLRIPYWESKNIETIIDNCLQRLSEKEQVFTCYATV